LAIILFLLTGMACGLSSELQSTATIGERSSAGQTDEPEQSLPTATRISPTTADLAKAVVQVLALTQEGSTIRIVWSGSGSIISSEGLILTNAHVVDNSEGLYERLGIALTDRTDQPPELAFYAEVLAIDYPLDLAVVAIVSDVDGAPTEVEFPYVSLGDSDRLEIGDSLRILGYPGIGGETITLTEGPVSGFTTERSVDGRAWIKTEATIAGGNSGGLAVNEGGQLIGIPTIVSSGSADGETVDCRPLADTNRDGTIDEMDSCVSVGGFINALRPVNLAEPLIEAALADRSYVSGEPPEVSNAAEPALSSGYFYNLEFSDGVTADDLPKQLWYALPSGSDELCLFWDYEGLANGIGWGVHWFFNGEYLEDVSMPNQIWQGGPQGNWWTCITSEENLENGLYEVSLEAAGEVLATESIFIGGERSLIEFELMNRAALPICYVYFSPSLAQNWGQDELAADEIMDPGESRVFPIVTGEYDLRMEDCAGDPIYEEFNLDLNRIQSLEVEGS
jgi:S1-C subfamily serine protease